MLQKNYKFEIIKELMKNNNHIRGLARKVGVNQTTIARKLNELYNENVVDYKLEGKNKIYFLKRSLEAFQMVLIVEHYKLLQLLEKYPQFRVIFQSIELNKKIRFAILFGSYAKGFETSESDIDIFIETQSKEIKEMIERLNSKINVKIGKFNKSSPLVREIIENHIIIKGVEEYYGRIGFFKQTHC